MKKTAVVPLFLALAATTSPSGFASDLVRTGAGARALGMANIAGLADDPLAALTANPALLSGQDKSWQLSAQGMLVDSTFTSSLGQRDSAAKGPGVLPDAAFVLPLADGPWTLGGGITVQSGMQAKFDFTDPPGTLGVSYGRQVHESRFAVVNAALAASYAVDERLSVGLRAGIAYNRDQLRAPYIFQSHPALQGLKVLVDLDVKDYAPTLGFGVDYKLANGGRLYGSYSVKTDFSADGNTTGDLGQLGLFNQADFAYDTVVKTAMPAFASAGIVWPAAGNLALGLQLDWISWSDAFDTLPLLFTNGTNDELNAFLGSTNIADTAPLDWHDQVTLHVGGQWAVGNRTWRLGYDYSNVPTPAATMTPMTGAILRHGLSAGLSLPFNDRRLDLAYRLSVGNGTTRIDADALKGPEYRGSSLDLVLHSIAVSMTF